MSSARVLAHPNLLSIEQLVLVIDALEARVARLEGHAERGNGRRTRAQEIENRRRWVDAMDAFIAGDDAALRLFHEMGGWVPPAQYR